MKRKLGICEWSLPVSGATAIEIAAEAGFEGMQIGEAGGRLAAFPLNNQKVQESYNQAALKYGIKLHFFELRRAFVRRNSQLSAGLVLRPSCHREFDKGI